MHYTCSVMYIKYSLPVFEHCFHRKLGILESTQLRNMICNSFISLWAINTFNSLSLTILVPSQTFLSSSFPSPVFLLSSSFLSIFLYIVFLVHSLFLPLFTIISPPIGSPFSFSYTIPLICSVPYLSRHCTTQAPSCFRASCKQEEMVGSEKSYSVRTCMRRLLV